METSYGLVSWNNMPLTWHKRLDFFETRNACFGFLGYINIHARTLLFCHMKSATFRHAGIVSVGCSMVNLTRGVSYILCAASSYVLGVDEEEHVGEAVKVLDQDALHDLRVHGDDDGPDALVPPVGLGAEPPELLLVVPVQADPVEAERAGAEEERRPGRAVHRDAQGLQVAPLPLQEGPQQEEERHRPAERDEEGQRHIPPYSPENNGRALHFPEERGRGGGGGRDRQEEAGLSEHA